MLMPGRKHSIANTNYRYGFNGQEKSDEIAPNTTTALFWEYDSRIVRRWNVDPVADKFPWQSSYSTMDNNPILKNDPTGETGIVTVNKQAKTITVYSQMIFYGDASNSQLSAKTAKNIENLWNAANGTVMMKTGVNKRGKPIYETYKVKFSIDVETRNSYDFGDKIISFLSGRKSLENEIKTNTDYSKNYIRVENNTSQNVSYYDGNGNTGVFKKDNISSANSTTEGHEYGHGIGLWPGTPDSHPPLHNLIGKGQPGIMYPRGTLVDAPFTYNPALGASTVNSSGNGVNTLNPETRKVTQTDIDALGLDKLKYNSNGQATIGNLTNQYHKKGD